MKKLFVLILVLLLTFGTTSGYCEKTANPDGSYTVGIPTDGLVFFSAPEGHGRQRSANWCWAACIQMVLNYHGIPVEQETIVNKVFGSLIDQPANTEHIDFALNGWGTDENGRDVVVSAISYQIDETIVIRDLAYRWPLIVGLKGDPIGHAYVLTALTYRNEGNPIITEVVLRDPFPKNKSRVTMPWQEFLNRCILITRVSVVR